MTAKQTKLRTPYKYYILFISSIHSWLDYAFGFEETIFGPVKYEEKMQLKLETSKQKYVVQVEIYC